MNTILVADDDPDILKSIQLRLVTNGYRVFTAQDGLWALVLAKREKPDLIVLDVKMPCGDGQRVYDALKDSIDTAFIPVIFITAYPDEKMRKRLLNVGASEFIAKPFTSNELLEKIKKVLKQMEKDKP